MINHTPARMTKQEFLDTYGSAAVTFNFYYKGIFHFTGLMPDESLVKVGIGGPDILDIYRLEVVADLPMCAGDCPDITRYGKVSKNRVVLAEFAEGKE